MAARSLTREPTSCWPTGTIRPRTSEPKHQLTAYRAFTRRDLSDNLVPWTRHAGNRAGRGPGRASSRGLGRHVAAPVRMARAAAAQCLAHRSPRDRLRFQLMVLWCRERLGANSLPTAIGGYRQFRRAFPAEGVRVVATIRHASETRAVADIEFLDARGAVVARIDGVRVRHRPSLNQAFRRNQLASVAHVLGRVTCQVTPGAQPVREPRVWNYQELSETTLSRPAPRLAGPRGVRGPGAREVIRFSICPVPSS